jgi:hypothetical protein
VDSKCVVRDLDFVESLREDQSRYFEIDPVAQLTLTKEEKADLPNPNVGFDQVPIGPEQAYEDWRDSAGGLAWYSGVRKLVEREAASH